MIKIYLDQSAYSQFLNESAGNWKQAEIAQILIHARDSGEAQVWASPTNVLETAQAKVRRRELASIILSLTNAKRMWHGGEFERVRDFLGFFDILAPGFWRQREFYKHHSQVSRRTWIGALALAACPEELDLSALISSMLTIKTTSRLIHARFAAQPSNWINQMLSTIDNKLTTTADPFEEFNKMSISEMEAEIASLETQFQKLGAHELQQLNKNRHRLANSYGCIEVGRLLQTIFDLPMELEMMVNVCPLVKNWEIVQAQLGCDSLPKDVAMADEKDLLSDMRLIQTVLQHAIFAAAKADLVSSAVGYEVIFRELQRCINKRAIPSGGLTFDADHSAAITWCDVFISNDGYLVESLKTLSKYVEERSKGKLAPSVVTTAGQLSKAIATQKEIVKGRVASDTDEM